MPRLKLSEGMKFERWTVLGYSGQDKYQKSLFYCQCECGVKREVCGSLLVNGKSKSCGCLQKERARQAKTTHGSSYSPEHNSWTNIRSRCNNPNHPDFDHYGGRGITICERWNSFALFLEDMGNKPSPNHSVERIDNDKGYQPGNCIWATQLIQTKNQRNRKNNSTQTRGVYYRKKENKYVATITTNNKRTYLGYFDSYNDAVKARKEAEKIYWNKEE